MSRAGQHATCRYSFRPPQAIPYPSAVFARDALEQQYQRAVEDLRREVGHPKKLRDRWRFWRARRHRTTEGPGEGRAQGARVIHREEEVIRHGEVDTSADAAWSAEAGHQEAAA